MNPHAPDNSDKLISDPSSEDGEWDEDDDHDVEIIYPHGTFSATSSVEDENIDGDGYPEDTGPSKSQLKRDAHKLLDLGKQLVELGESELDSIPLESHIRDAISHAKKIKAHGALKRQYHYLGKLLRKTDATPIFQALEILKRSANAETRLLHDTERWRDRLLSEEKPAMTEFFSLYPEAERQQLRQLLRNCRRERGHNRPAKSYREIFKWLRAVITRNEA